MTLSDKSAQRNLSAIVDFSNLINSSLSLDFILNNLLLTCLSKFLISRGMVGIYNEKGILDFRASKGILQIDEDIKNVKRENILSDVFIQDLYNKYKIDYHQEIVSSRGNLGCIFLGQKLSGEDYKFEDKDFLITLVNIASTAIENSLIFQELKDLNRNLEEKVNRLSSLFDLGKEFSSILDISRVIKILTFSILGQLLVSKYSIIICDNDSTFKLLDSKYDETQIKTIFTSCNLLKIDEPLNKDEIINKIPELNKLGVNLIVPMKIKNEVKGLILLGGRVNKIDFTYSDIEYISSVANLAMISIENARLFQETLEKEKMEKDLEVARSIQKNLLPKSIPIYETLDIAAESISARQVGGDYYDVITMDDQSTIIAIADVSGKGVQAALLMANLQAFLRSVCKQNLPIEKATNIINDLLVENILMGSFITFFWASISPDKKKLTYINAGHNPPFLIKRNEVIRLKKGGMILGVMPTVVPYLSETIEINQGDLLCLFTDGISEAFNNKLEEFSEERLEHFLLENSTLSASEIIKELKRKLRDFTQGADQSDDITVVISKFN